ncbi:hypothetical protein BS47DRAFT_970691 [Hydnum rufescens UP504]|uniref:SAP domain-containing protein n=1 Tax=Hydnum rufescens UP504 TaxID=1448309 RepID=A0A9P6AY32_9AGAM|nr:hypothetical protein BS47DRAFT_970691 [Hydnum rufescens UP504]
MAVSVDPNELRLPLKKAHASEEQGYVVYHDPQILTVVQLKTLLTEHNLPMGGNKSVLIERLAKFAENPSGWSIMYRAVHAAIRAQQLFGPNTMPRSTSRKKWQVKMIPPNLLPVHALCGSLLTVWQRP